MEKEVRPIDANATIEALRANFQQGSWYGCEDPLYQIAEDTIAEMPTLEDHFPDPTKMIPLTLEQLRKMDGQPVWVEDLEKSERSWWRLIYWDRGKYMVLLSKSVEGYILEEYGKTWLAYAYPPAHIDRESWEECESCETCVSCKNSLVPYGENPCKECSFGERECYEPRNFCPDFGRPLTEEAWAELEKRMGVRV